MHAYYVGTYYIYRYKNTKTGALKFSYHDLEHVDKTMKIKLKKSSFEDIFSNIFRGASF